MRELEAALGHTFENPALLKKALTHSSLARETEGLADNERLEFLGDAVLQLAVTDYLFVNYPHLPEGHLAKARSAVVSGDALAEVAATVGLGRHILLGQGEEMTEGRRKASILANTMEALLGAVYLDAGFETAKAVVLDLWGGRIDERARTPGVSDYKTRLQEMLAVSGRLPQYAVSGSGPTHDPVFVAEVSIEGAVLGRGEGRSKKQAEQAAAEAALQRLDQIGR